jgi:hypothetical protein
MAHIFKLFHYDIFLYKIIPWRRAKPPPQAGQKRDITRKSDHGIIIYLIILVCYHYFNFSRVHQMKRGGCPARPSL